MTEGCLRISFTIFSIRHPEARSDRLITILRSGIDVATIPPIRVPALRGFMTTR
jgi:hypothetical protein